MTEAAPPALPLALRLPEAWPAGAAAAELPGGRLHLQHGPIDLVITVEAGAAARHRAIAVGLHRFAGILPGLAAELATLRQQAISGAIPVAGPVARRMQHAVAPFAGDRFITPMAAVAGAVADHMATAMAAAAPLRRLIVNNGGDIALRLAPGETARLLLCTDPTPEGPVASGAVEIGAGDGIAGIATSGWRGRSHSLGIADAVTVFAESAATADAAATLIANAVDLPDAPARIPYVTRSPASSLAPESDLGDRLVTTRVAPLPQDLADAALARGQALAARFATAGHIRGAHLTLGEHTAIAGAPPPLARPAPIAGRWLAGGRSKARDASPATRERAPVRQALQKELSP